MNRPKLKQSGTTTISLWIIVPTDDPEAAYADLAPEIDEVCTRLGASWESKTYFVNQGEERDTIELIR